MSSQITAQELQVILAHLHQVLHLGVTGDVVELGCYSGTAALFEARALQEAAPHKSLWLYDSFEGLPEKTLPDQSPAGEQFVMGELKATRQQVLRHFQRAGLPKPKIKKAWFEDLGVKDLPDAICFAFLDGDYYRSIQTSLQLVWPKMSSGGVIIVDDYQNEALPGAAKAVDEWLQNHPGRLTIHSSLAIIKPAV